MRIRITELHHSGDQIEEGEIVLYGQTSFNDGQQIYQAPCVTIRKEDGEIRVIPLSCPYRYKIIQEFL